MDPNPTPVSMKDLDDRLRRAVQFFWETRAQQTTKQTGKGKDADRGGRASVTGGKQMDGFATLIAELLMENGVPKVSIRRNEGIELPGYYRPTKEWDLVVVHGGRLIAAMEFKSQVGPSFGNNFNNRTEEAIGSAVDLRAAYRKGAFASSGEPWLGYLMLLHKDPGSVRPVKAAEPNFRVFPEFRNASYAKRYEILCQRLVSEGLYTAACFLLSEEMHGQEGEYWEPSPAVAFGPFVTSLLTYVVENTRGRSEDKTGRVGLA